MYVAWKLQIHIQCICGLEVKLELWPWNWKDFLFGLEAGDVFMSFINLRLSSIRPEKNIFPET